MDWVEKAGAAIEPIVEAGVEQAKQAERHRIAEMLEARAERHWGEGNDYAGRMLQGVAARLRAKAEEK